MALQQVVEQTVTGLGYELVEIERSAGGLLRITIDHPWQPGDQGEGRFVNVEDCEKVTRQLQFTLEVEAADYRRLEVSSPGIDRPLRNRTDFERFAGQLVDLTLKAPLGAVASGGLHANRKKFRGTLERVAPVEADGEPGWQLLWTEEPPASKPGQRPGKKSAKKNEPVQVLGFALDEVRDARLAPIVNFKGRGGAGNPD